MNKKWIIIWAGIVIIAVLVIRYGFILVFWLTTPKDGELRTEELALFQKIKTDMNIDKVSREPRYKMSQPDDTLSYKLFINDVNCSKWDNRQLQYQSDKIKKEIDQIHLHKNFYKYVVIYRCKDGGDKRFSYLR